MYIFLNNSFWCHDEHENLRFYPPIHILKSWMWWNMPCSPGPGDSNVLLYRFCQPVVLLNWWTPASVRDCLEDTWCWILASACMYKHECVCVPTNRYIHTLYTQTYTHTPRRYSLTHLLFFCSAVLLLEESENENCHHCFKALSAYK